MNNNNNTNKLKCNTDLSNSVSLILWENNLHYTIKTVPVFCYPDADIYKAKLLRYNKNKSGIYRWTNNTNNKSYIGSSKCLSARLNVYYSPTTLKKKLEKGRSAIHSALLKYSYSNFKLDIIEYCEQDLLISREQYYLDLLKPEYNICKKAGSTLGKKRSESTNEKMSKIRNKITITTGVNVKVFDIEDNFIKEFPSINSAAKYFDVSSTTINTAIKKGKTYQNLIFKSEIKDNRIWVYDSNYKLIKVLDNASKASKWFNIPSTTLSRYIKSKKIWKNKYYFYKICLKASS